MDFDPQNLSRLNQSFCYRDILVAGIGISWWAKDQDVAVLIKEFDYDLNEEVEPRRDDIWKT